MATLYELIGFSTERPGFVDVRFRDYTTSGRKAEKFSKIPKIQFSDSNHGIVFSAIPCRSRTKPKINILQDYVNKHMSD